MTLFLTFRDLVKLLEYLEGPAWPSQPLLLAPGQLSGPGLASQPHAQVRGVVIGSCPVFPLVWGGGGRGFVWLCVVCVWGEGVEFTGVLVGRGSTVWGVEHTVSTISVRGGSNSIFGVHNFSICCILYSPLSLCPLHCKWTARRLLQPKKTSG